LPHAKVFESVDAHEWAEGSLHANPPSRGPGTKDGPSTKS
jgi:hypothetical protein